MNEVVKTQDTQNFALQVEEKKNELTTILQKSVQKPVYLNSLKLARKKFPL